MISAGRVGQEVWHSDFCSSSLGERLLGLVEDFGVGFVADPLHVELLCLVAGSLQVWVFFLVPRMLLRELVSILALVGLPFRPLVLHNEPCKRRVVTLH